MPKGNYLKRLQAVKKQFVWLRAAQLDALNGISAMIIWASVAYYVSVATNQCISLEARGGRNSAPRIPKKCVVERVVPHQTNRFSLQILIIPHPSQIVIGADCKNKD